MTAIMKITNLCSDLRGPRSFIVLMADNAETFVSVNKMNIEFEEGSKTDVETKLKSEAVAYLKKAIEALEN